MKPASFEYHRPATVSEAVSLLAEYGDDAKPLAGGQSLVPMLALRLARFGHLIDLNRVEGLSGVTRSDGQLAVGSMTRQAAIERDATVSAAVAADVPLLARATPLIGHFQIRNRGTVGGSLAHADPASEYPAVATALGASFDIAGRAGTRSVDASAFFESTWMTCLASDELLTGVRFPIWGGRCGFAVEEMARRSGDFALAGAACAVAVDEGGRIARAGIGLFGVGSTPVRAEETERAAVGLTASDAPDLGELAAASLDPPDDVHATGSYRRRIAAHLVARALQAALEEAIHA